MTYQNHNEVKDIGFVDIDLIILHLVCDEFECDGISEGCPHFQR